MKSYWDHSTKERSQMIEADVKALLDIELMQKGCLAVKEPAYLTIEPVDVNSLKPKIFYEVLGLVFETAAQAQAVLDLKPLKSSYDYNGPGYDYKFPQQVVDANISQIQLYDEASITAMTIVLTKNRCAKDSNEKTKREYQKLAEQQAIVLNRVWDDWNECHDLQAKHQNVLNVLADYERIAGNRQMAMNFLKKAFTASQIEDAMTWFGLQSEIAEVA